MNIRECVSLLELLRKEMGFDPCKGDKEILEIQALDKAIDVLNACNEILPPEPLKPLENLFLEQKIKEACMVQWHGVPFKLQDHQKY